MPRYIVGIDLGTTNTVVAWSEPAGRGGGAISLLPLPQLIAPGEVAERALLPSQRYQAGAVEISDADVALPWSANLPERELVGQIARRLGAQVPGRLVGSAKSWLSHGAVDRLAPILPWGADDTVAKVSPVAASASYLAHVRAAWNHAHPGEPLEHQEVVLTVPASFDDAARELTLQAAREAGLPTLRLLEEPQAALYDWLFRHADELATALADSRLVLVCDVGGGTTDLSLIQVALDDGVPTLTRIGVGQHLMLGGDNMDLALAHLVEARLGSGSRLSAGRLAQLVERCRAAKEQLLAADAPEQVTVTLLGGGGRLVGASRSAVLTRDEVRHSIVDGFFPASGLNEPLKRSRAGLVEFGLPYASDPAVTRHVANFLRQHAEASRAATGALAIPDTVLLNGGVFRADALGRRLRDTLADWRGAPLVELHNVDPDVAVARGAVAYALALHGRAPRIGGGSPRSYFLVLDAAQQQGVCVLPQGAEPLDEQVLAGRTFALRVGQPVRFHLLSSSVERSGQAPARAGELVALDGLELTPLPPVATVVKPPRDDRRKEIAVQLVTCLSELGTLAMECVSVDDASLRWRLEFQLRADADADAASAASAAAKSASRLDEAVAQIEHIFGARSARHEAKEVKQLRATLERLLGARERWALDVLRTLFDALWQRARGRRRSAEHERVWLNLAGYCLRPGFGDALDEWRVEQLWTLFEQGLAHPQDARVCAEWWTLWRRVAGGLSDAAQQRLLDDFAQNLETLESGAKRPPGVVKAGADDMVRLGASLERIPAPHKVEIGDWLLGKLAAAEASPGLVAQLLWALGRLGAREPFHASAHAVVPPADAGRWLDALLALDWKKTEGAAFAAAHLARQSGDRTRDVPEALREKVVARLLSSQAAPSWVAMVRDGGRLDEAESRQVFGEALPPGLKLIS